MGKKLKNLINYAIIIVVFVFFLVYMLVTEGVENIVNAFANLNYGWILVCLLCMLIYWLCECQVLAMFIKRLDRRHRFATIARVTMIGQLFNCITPFASGGQPIQAYYLCKEKMPLSKALTALISKFIIYQSVLTLFSIAVIILRYQYFIENVSGFLSLAIIGFIINTLVIFFLLAVGYFKSFVIRLMNWLIWFLHKLHVLKKPEETKEKWGREIASFNENMAFIRTNVPLVLKTALLTLGQLFVYFAIPFFVGLALRDYSNLDLVNMICAQAFVLMVSSFVPLPGAAGAAEGSFFMFFSAFLQPSNIAYAILIWRFFVFYLPILVGVFFMRGKKHIVEQAEELQNSIDNSSSF